MNYKNEKINQNQIFILALIGYLLSYIFLYIRYTYFAGANSMRFPVDMLTMTPPCNDLYVSAKYAIQTLHAGKIVGVPFVYSPLFVLIYSPLSFFDFNTLRWLSFLTIIISYVLIGFIFPKFWKCNLLESPTALLILITGFTSYGMRFELERGQWNIQTLLLCMLGLALKDSKNNIIIFISYLLFSISVHLKLYPLLFIIGYITPSDGWIKNSKRLIYIGIINILLLFCLGFSFLKEYLYTLTQYAANPSIWIANISLYSYIKLISNYTSIDINTLKILSNIYIIIYFASIIMALYKGMRGDNGILLFQIAIGATLFPTVSFDYKISIITLCAAHFFSTYKFNKNNYCMNRISFVYKSNIFSINPSYLIENIVHTIEVTPN